MSKFTKSMFESIKEELNKSKAKSGVREILRTPPGHTYTVRLVPNLEEPKKTFFHYFNFGWESYATGEYVQFVSPSTWGERDPIAEGRLRLLKHGTVEQVEKAKKLMRRENWFVNVYVVNDTNDPENNGKVKILRYGKQLQKIIDEAMNGEDSDEFGERIFDLSPDGCSFKIKVERQGEYPTFVSSRFASSGEIPGVGEDKKKMEAIYNSVHELDDVLKVLSFDELEEAFNTHFLCEQPKQVEETVAVAAPEKSKVVSRDLPTPSDDDDDDDDDEDLDDDTVSELLKGLG
jgi:hypothetical protein